MKSAQIVFIVLLTFIGGMLLWYPSHVFAQENTSSLGIATYVPITGKNISTGKIVSFTNNGYHLTTIAYDPLIVGVVTQNPAVAIVEKGAGNFPIVSSGNAYVLVSGQNGSIKKGDLVTSSTVPGIGAKATHSGYVIGTALIGFTPKSPTDVAQIPVSLNIHYFATSATVSSNLLDVLHISEAATYEQPLTVFKYVVAALVLVVSVAFGFWFFGQTANRGIEAIGRNPLASKIIQLGILLNVIITVSIVAAGIAVAFFVLRY